MFRPKKHLKLELLKSTPSINDLKQALDHARKLRGCTIELPWDLDKYKASFALAVRIEVGAEESFWTLYSGEGNKSRVLWSAPFSDIHLLKEVLSLSLSEAIGQDEDASSYKDASRASLAAEEKKSSENKREVEESSAHKSQQDSQSLPFHPQIQSPPQQPNAQSYSNNTSNNSQVNLPAQNFYPNMQPGSTGNFPALPPQNPQMPMPYVYYYPGYPYPIPMPYPPGMPSPANSVPLQQGMPVFDPNASSSRLPAPDAELLRKQTNYMIGQFLVESKLIADTTLKIALKLQEMVVGNVISTEQAYHAIKDVHHSGGHLDVAQLIKDSPTSGNTTTAAKQSYPLLGDLLVEAKVLNRSTLDAVLKMQEIVRAGAISKDEACQAIIKEMAKAAPAKKKAESEKEQKVIDLLIRCSLISVHDKETALSVQKKHGGQLGQILVSAGKLHLKTYLAAVEGESWLTQKKIKLEQVVIALNYCARTRINLSEAIKELGFVENQ